MTDSHVRRPAMSASKKALLEKLLREEGLSRGGSQGIEKREDSGHAPLSFSQRRLWLLEQFLTNVPVYNVPAAVRLTGPLDLAALSWAIGAVLARHEVLRTTFRADAEVPVQIVGPPPAAPLLIEDLRGMPEDARWDEAKERAVNEFRRAFDLSTGPLFRAKVWKLGEEDHLMLLSMHHIVSDAVTVAIVFDEIRSFYDARLRGEDAVLPAPAFQHGDYAAWQGRWIEGDEVQAELAYWKERLSGSLPTLNLPTSRPRRSQQTFAGAWMSQRLPAHLLEPLRALAKAENASLFMVFLAVFKVLLHRYTRQEDILVGVPAAMRNRVELERMPGFFVNTLVLRSDLSGSPSFRELVRKVREVTLEGFAHKNVPFERVVEMVQPERDLSRTPIFQVMYDHRRELVRELPLSGLRGSTVLGEDDVHSGTAKVDLAFYTEEHDDGLTAAFEFNTDLFDEATMRRFLGHVEVLLKAIVENPDRSIHELRILGAMERHDLLVEWNDTAVAYPDTETIPSIVAQCARRTPDAPAIESKSETITYRKLEQRANRLAHHLVELGIRPGDHVAICAERSNELIVALLGILKTGAAYVPLDPNYPQERLDFMLADSGARLLVTHAHLDERFGATELEKVHLDAHAARIAEHSDVSPAVTPDPDASAYVIYTSGSTGRPKGVPIPHRGVLRLMFGNDWLVLGPDVRICHLAPFSFDASILDIWSALCFGGCVIPYPDRVPSIELLRRIIREHRVNSLFLTTALFNTIIDEAPEILTPVRQVATGGEAMSARHIRRQQRELPGLRLTNCYGPTECSVISTSWVVPTPLPTELTTVPIGKPIGNTCAFVLDQRLRPVPIGVPGELFVGGPGLSPGYLGRPDLSAESFIPHPFSDDPDARLYRTGDLVRWTQEGVLEFLGRDDDQVKIRGHRIELGEIEAVLGRFDALQKGVVLAREDRPGELRLVAYVEERPDVRLSVDELRMYLADALPDYMMPAAIVPLEALPMSPGGKVDRAALPKPPETDPRDESYSAPRTPIEQMLAAQWVDVLEIPRVGIRDDFFDLGGHSLMAAVLLSRIRQSMGIDLSLKSFFQAKTIEELARIIEHDRTDGKSTAAPPIVRRGLRETSLSFNQQGLWYLQKLAPESPFYNVPVALRLHGEVDVRALERSIQETVRRHEALRTVFRTGSDRPLSVVLDFEPTPLAVEDLSELADTEREARRREVEAQAAQAAFNLETGPLFRCRLIHLSAQEAVLVINVHHIILDGWSMGVLIEELTTLYDAFARGAESPLPDLEIQYHDFTAWQRDWLKDERWQEQVDYWRGKLDGVPPLLELPTDAPRPEIQNWSGASLAQTLSKETAHDLRKVCVKNGSTIFMALLAVTEVLLQRYSRKNDFVVGSPVAGRCRQEVERMLGFFLNVVSLRSDLEDDPTFEELLRRVRETTLSAYEHQDLPFESLVEELAPERNISYTPIYQVLYNYRTPGKPIEANGITFDAPVEISTSSAKTDLIITVDDGGADIVVDFTYNTDLFHESSIRNMSVHFENLLRAALSDPSRPVSELDLLDPKETRRLLETWNGPSADYPKQSTVAETFQAAATTHADQVAVRYGSESLTYSQLNRRANRVAHFLAERGVGPDVRVALCLERSLETVVCILGILKAGGAYVPLDPAYPKERLAFMMRDTAAPILLAHESLAANLPNHQAETLFLEGIRPVIEAASDEDPPFATTTDGLAYVMYTSGSTGKPKGVEVTHRAILRLVFGQTFCHFGPDTTFLQMAPVSFDASTLELWGPLLHGGKLVVHAEPVPTSDGIADAVRENEVTTMWLTAALFNAVIDERPTALLGVKELLTGGEALSVAHVQRAYAALPDVQLINGYGPTENTTFTCCYRIPRTLFDEGLNTIPIGTPISHTSVYVLDEHLRLVPPGVSGQLYTGGAGLSRGYLNRADLNQERFVQNPFGEGRLYATGDIVRHLADGRIEYLGRNDFQVKVRGFRIELGEIETLLSEHPGVRNCVVTVHTDETAGKRLVAYIVRTEGRETEIPELIDYIRSRLPDYMVPSAFTFLEALPLSANGKVDRVKLPAPAFDTVVDGKTLPRNEMERHLAQVWERVLRVTDIGVNDDFFDLGGHSLLAVRLLGEIRDVFGQELPLSSMINAPTVAAQAQALYLGVGGSDNNCVVKIQPKGEKAPVFCVCSLGGTVLNQRPLAMALGENQPFYGLQAINLDTKLGRPAEIEDYAKAYIDAMLEVQPEGPYIIGGHSFGGVVSYEIAQQLQAAGKEVTLLFILDSTLPNLGKKRMFDRFASIFAFLRGLPFVPGTIVQQALRDPGQLRREVRQKLRFVQRKLFRRRARGANVTHPAAAPGPAGARAGQAGGGRLRAADIVEMSNWPENNRRIAERHYRAVLNYQPKRYPGPITLFRSRFQSPFLGRGFRMGWEKVTDRKVTVRTVPGGHLSILVPPNVYVLAKKMRREVSSRR